MHEAQASSTSSFSSSSSSFPVSGNAAPSQVSADQASGQGVQVPVPGSGPVPAQARPQPQARSSYAVFRDISTRWSDNDVYGHVNNVIYYSWFDTAVNAYLMDCGALDIHAGQTIGLVIETQCNYFASLAFPQQVQAGIRVAHVGRSSVRYEVGLFAQEQDLSAAAGHFVHVYVNRQTRRPVPLPDSLQSALQPLLRLAPV